MTDGIDSSLASVAPVAVEERGRSLSVAAVPPLAWMAGLAAIANLIINRVLIKLGHEQWSTSTLIALDRWGGFARNLSVVSALVVLGFCLVAFASRRSGLPLSARSGVAGFGWVLVPIVTLMTFLPLAWTRVELVLVVAGLSHALILLLILSGLHWRSSAAGVGALVLTLIAALSGLASTVVMMVGGRPYWPETERLANAFRWSGELAYLAVPIAASFALAIPWRTLRGKIALLLSTLVAAGVAVGIALWQRAAGADLATRMYGALGLDLLPDAYVTLYAIPLGVACAVTAAAAVSADPARRQIGAALVLLLSAGYAPRTPGGLTLTVVGVALLVRSAVAIAHRRR